MMSSAPTPDPAGIPALQDAIRHMHGVESRFIEWQVVSDTFQGKIVFERTVGIFEVIAHPATTRAYAWSDPATLSSKARRFFAVLQLPPFLSALSAVRGSIVAGARGRNS